MGITGLLPFLEKSLKKTNINQFAGCTVAIDSYCWLHKGIFSCADKLSMGQPTLAYVHYSMKFIHMLLANKIKPILVFDGRNLPAKAQTEAKRHESREANRRKGIELMQMGQHAEGRNLLRRSINVTHEMALELIKQCQEMNIDCIVAPYEADAQLAYLNISGIADLVITEDSDLTLFGCKKIFFKMDINGNGVLVDQEKLYLAMDTKAECFNMDNFRYMCILSGCDYLPSLPGIGLHKARKFITKNTDCDIHRALTRLGSYLNMKSLVVTKEYRDAFILALITFKHQLVFCPLQRKQVRLNPPTPDVTQEQLYYAGEETNPDVALQLAFGNCDPDSLKMLHNFDPDRLQNKEGSNSKGRKKTKAENVSIWSQNYTLKSQQEESPKQAMTWANTAGKEVVLKTNRLKKTILVKQQDDSDDKILSQTEMLDMYRPKDIIQNEDKEISIEEDKVSPVLIRRTNPFAKQASNTKVSPSLLSKGRSRIKGRSIMRVRRTVIDEDTITESKYFSKPCNERGDNATDVGTLCSSRDQEEVPLKNGKTETEKNESTNNINFNSIMEVDDDKTNSHQMDVDEDIHDRLFEQQEYKETDENICNDRVVTPHYEYLDTSSNCDLGKSYLDVKRRRVLATSYSTKESCNLNTSCTSMQPDVDTDFLIQSEGVDSSHSVLFKWSTTNCTEPTPQKLKHDTSKSNSRASITNGPRRSKRLTAVERQQGLLSMYGFQKKTNLNH